MQHSEFLFHVFCALAFFLFITGSYVDAGCAKLDRCCPGKMSSCKYEYGSGGRYTRACYCDDFCRKSGDCCSDYKEHCLYRAQDCIMTYWSHWSYCTARCGRGTRERRRKVHIAPSNGGKPCGERRQTKACYHNSRRCPNSEIAQILPAYLNRYRNIPDKYERPSEIKKRAKWRKSYCIHYRITSMSWYCRYASPYHTMKKGVEVCTECHGIAMNDEGHCQGANVGMVSRWRALEGRSCYGAWESIGEPIQDCRCGEEHGKNFIFV